VVCQARGNDVKIPGFLGWSARNFGVSQGRTLGSAPAL